MHMLSLLGCRFLTLEQRRICFTFFNCYNLEFFFGLGMNNSCSLMFSYRLISSLIRMKEAYLCFMSMFIRICPQISNKLLLIPDHKTLTFVVQACLCEHFK